MGISRNRAVDLFSIAAAALELQLHVLTRLGKRPSLAAWRQMLARGINVAVGTDSCASSPNLF